MTHSVSVQSLGNVLSVVAGLLLLHNAPEQNPIENVWLQAKEFVRKNWHQCKVFQHVTDLFEYALNTIKFDFDRLHMYMSDLQLI